MHTLYFVKLRKEIETAEEAIREATAELDNNNFTSDNFGYFGSSKADWYVVGGRWSGELSRLSVSKEKLEEANNALKEYLNADKDLEKKFKQQPDWLDWLYINSHQLPDERKAQIIEDMDNIYKKIVGFPYFRDTYHQNGYFDDAMRLTPELIKKLKEKYPDTEIFEPDACEEITCKHLLLGEGNDEGSWLVVIDYHY